LHDILGLMETGWLNPIMTRILTQFNIKSNIAICKIPPELGSKMNDIA